MHIENDNMFEFTPYMSPADRLRTTSGRARIIASTTEEAPTSTADAKGAYYWLSKPFSDLSKALIKTIASVYHIGLKVSLLAQSVYFVVGNILPLVAAGAVAKFAGAENAARSLYNKAHDIAKNNIRIISMAKVLDYALQQLPTLSPWVAFRTTAATLPVMTGIMVTTAATLWSDRVTRAIHKMGVKLGFVQENPDLVDAMASSADNANNYRRMAEMGGAMAATAAAVVAAPTVASLMAPCTVILGPTALVTRPLLAAFGAAAGGSLYDSATAAPSTTATATSDASHVLETEPNPVGVTNPPVMSAPQNTM